MNCGTANGNRSFSERSFNLAVTKITWVLNPDGVADHHRKQAVRFFVVESRKRFGR
ncbi:MAG: hypothetical protein ACJARY_003063 [Candidatus Azotimanducaceae bacterium]|jgi:hypothetical protein